MSTSTGLEVRCSCGQVYHADPAHAGRAIRCRCGELLRIPRSRPKARRAGRLAKVRTSTKLQRYLIRASWAYLAGVSAYAALLWGLGDSWWVATALLFGPRWPAIVPAALLALAAALARPRLLLPIAGAAVIALGPVMGYRIGWRSWLGSPRGQNLRIITFNVEGGVNPELLGVPGELERYQPDVMVFQECASRLNATQFWPAGWTVRQDGGFCLGTRWPVLDVRELERVETGEFGGTGNAVRYRLQVRNDTVDLVVVHLETPRKGLESLRYGSDASRMNPSLLVREIGSRRISRWVRQQSQEPIVAGDFNMPVESVIYRRYWNDCGNAFSRTGHGFGGTRVLRHFSIRIDHVLACGRWRPVRAFVGPDLGSDHLPLIVDVNRSP